MQINNSGDFTIEDFYWKDFNVGLIADFESRLSIFYSDFENDENNSYKITEAPELDYNRLEKAIDKLLEIIKTRFS